MREAACSGEAPNRRKNPDEPDIFFPEKGESPNEAKMICASCPVLPQCRDYQDRTESQYGVWGGRIKPRSKA